MTRSLNVIFAVCAALSVWALFSVQPGAAAPTLVPFNVTSTLDDVDDNPGNGLCHTSTSGPAAGLCTLRAAVMEANHTSGPGAIISVPAGIYTLTISATSAPGETNGDLDLIAPTVGSPLINIIGAGAASTIIDANQLDRVFLVQSGRTATISGVTLRNGYTNDYGGGIFNQGTLTVTNATFSRNYAGHDGGGFFNNGTLTLNQSTLNQNSAVRGGGIETFHGSLIVNRSTISGNTALFSGGGIFNSASLFVINSTLSGNSAKVNGGGIFNVGSTVNVYNSTIVYNAADSDANVTGSAGGVFNDDIDPNAIFNLVNTLLAANTVGNAASYDECGGTLNSYGTNRIGLAGQGGLCAITQVGAGSHPTLNSSSLLGPLQNNGGPTWTHALLAGSNAIDAGDPTVGCVDQAYLPLATDQRGAPRVFGVSCDIGAFEYRTPLYLPLIRR